MASKRLTKDEVTVLALFAVNPMDEDIPTVFERAANVLSPRATKIGHAIIAVAKKESLKGHNTAHVKYARNLLKWAKKNPVAGK